MPAPLTHAFANRAVRHGNHPMVGAMRAYILGYLALVPHRRDYAPIHPVLCSLKRHVDAEGKVAYGEFVRG